MRTSFNITLTNEYSESAALVLTVFCTIQGAHNIRDNGNRVLAARPGRSGRYHGQVNLYIIILFKSAFITKRPG